MYFNFANDYFSIFFQNLLDSETFTKFQELLCPKTYWKRTINMIEIIPTKNTAANPTIFNFHQ